MNTAALPSPVIVVVRSVPHIVSTVAGMTVPSCCAVGVVRRPASVRADHSAASTAAPAGAMSGSHRGVAAPPLAPPLAPPTGLRPAEPSGKLRPHLAMTFAVERAGGEDGARVATSSAASDMAHGPDRPAPLRCRGPRRGTMAVDAGSGEPPGAADRGPAIRFAADRRDGPAHGVRRGRPKGRWLSKIAIFSCSKSRSINASPSLALSRSLSSSSPLPDRGRFSSTFRNLGRVAQGIRKPLQESDWDLDDLRALPGHGQTRRAPENLPNCGNGVAEGWLTLVVPCSGSRADHTDWGVGPADRPKP